MREYLEEEARYQRDTAPYHPLPPPTTPFPTLPIVGSRAREDLEEEARYQRDTAPFPSRQYPAPSRQ